MNFKLNPKFTKMRAQNIKQSGVSSALLATGLVSKTGGPDDVPS